MNILIAPDSFKGTLTAQEVCDIIGQAFADTINNIKITKLPAADGGEGLCACVLTQVSDVEDETNGLVTYDRAEIKVDIAPMRKIAEQLSEAIGHNDR